MHFEQCLFTVLTHKLIYCIDMCHFPINLGLMRRNSNSLGTRIEISVSPISPSTGDFIEPFAKQGISERKKKLTLSHAFHPSTVNYTPFTLCLVSQIDELQVILGWPPSESRMISPRVGYRSRPDPRCVKGNKPPPDVSSDSVSDVFGHRVWRWELKH